MSRTTKADFKYAKESGVKYCPFCGSINLKWCPGPVPRCMNCRTVFMVSYSRKVRKSPTRKVKT